MLVIKPETRWSIQEVLKSLASILYQRRQRGDSAEDYYVERSQAISLTNHLPPLWDEDEYLQHIRQHSSTKHSTQYDLTPSARLGIPALSRDPKDVSDAAGSKQDMEQPLNAFANDTMPSSGPVRVQHTRSTTIAASPTVPKDDDILPKGQSPENHLRESLTTTIMGAPRQEHSLQQGSVCVSDQILDLSPDKDFLKVIVNIGVSQKPGFPSTPASSHRLASTSKAHSTCTEEPRPSVSSRTDESMLRLQGCSQISHHTGGFHSVPREDMPKPEVLAHSLPAGENGATKADTSRGSGATETRSSRKYRLTLWWKLRLQGFRSILIKGRRH